MASTLNPEQPSSEAVLQYLQAAGYRLNESTLNSIAIGALYKICLDDGSIPEAVFAECMSAVFGLPYLKRESMPTSVVSGTEALRSFLIESEAVPIRVQEGGLLVATVDPSNDAIVPVLRAKLNLPIMLCTGSRSDILESLHRLYPKLESPHLVAAQDVPSDIDSDSTLVRDVHRVIQRAVTLGASDIHFEPLEQQLRVRFRVHGVMRNAHLFESSQSTQVIARIKLMARLDVTEKRSAQNGRFKFPAEGRVLDIRVSSLPLHQGESVVLRLLEFDPERLHLNRLGFSDSVCEQLDLALSAQQGLVLVTGPTGSGKSTTLYALLNQLNSPALKIVTIEDPVEIKIAGINQIQVDEEHGLSFSEALKTVLRQDPDVIMVGEIRDSATAQLAAQAALTGHLVLSTLHTVSATSVYSRLVNLGLPNYLIAATMRTVVAQRLVRTVCSECSGVRQANPNCQSCYGTGFTGRCAVAEVIPYAAFNALAESPEDWPKTRWHDFLLQGVTLHHDAQRLIDAGLTTSAEAARVMGVPSA